MKCYVYGSVYRSVIPTPGVFWDFYQLGVSSPLSASAWNLPVGLMQIKWTDAWYKVILRALKVQTFSVGLGAWFPRGIFLKLCCVVLTALSTSWIHFCYIHPDLAEAPSPPPSPFFWIILQKIYRYKKNTEFKCRFPASSFQNWSPGPHFLNFLVPPLIFGSNILNLKRPFENSGAIPRIGILVLLFSCCSKFFFSYRFTLKNGEKI